MAVVHQRDLALAKRVQAGDRSAAMAVLRRLLPLAGQTARALAPRRGGTAEARNLAVLQILDEIATYHGDIALEAWARQITSPIVLRETHQRSGGARSHQSAESPQLSKVVLDALPRSLSSYLADLTEPTRSMVVLRHTVGHSVSEIAELCDVSESTITSLSPSRSICRTRYSRNPRQATPFCSSLSTMGKNISGMISSRPWKNTAARM